LSFGLAGDLSGAEEGGADAGGCVFSFIFSTARRTSSIDIVAGAVCFAGDLFASDAVLVGGVGFVTLGAGGFTDDSGAVASVEGAFESSVAAGGAAASEGAAPPVVPVSS
jgi:hypothetical protein